MLAEVKYHNYQLYEHYTNRYYEADVRDNSGEQHMIVKYEDKEEEEEEELITCI